jgi:hypothetical protein
MPHAAQPPLFPQRLFMGFSLVTLCVLLGAMIGGASTVVYASAVVAVIGAFALGFLGVARHWVEPKEAALLFVKPWLGLTAFAALSLFNGNYQPVLGFGAASALLFLLCWAGGAAGQRALRHS